ncbi:MAG: T9SS type A sorting domain-containing protein [Bacteroidota bacterium]|nr:T9SS type A sorting domain-containing protein [Bacteroidota bacterium]
MKSSKRKALVYIIMCLFTHFTFADITITISGFAFHPSSASLTIGEVINFINLDPNGHSVQYVSGGTAFSTTATMGQNGTAQITPVSTGTYNYRCGIHGSMTGSFTVNPPPPSISTSGLGNLTYCGGNITVPYSSSGTFNSGNIFSVELSDASGSFTNATILSTVSTTTSDITVSVPSGAKGTAYRVRVKASDPVIVGSNNGQDISLNFSATPNYGTSILPQGAICTGNNVTFTGSTSNITSPSFSWYFNNSIVGSNTTYVRTNMQNNDIGFLVISGTTQGCNPIAYNITTSSYIATVSGAVTPTLQISGLSTFCVGTPLTISGIPNGGGANPVFKLYINSQLYTTGNNPFTIIPASVTGIFTTTSLVSATMESSLSCATVQSVTSNVLTVTANNIPNTPLISLARTLVLCPLTNPCCNDVWLISSETNGIQWLLTSSGIISGATNNELTPTISGTYKVIRTVNGCSSTSDGYNFTKCENSTTVSTVSNPEIAEENTITIYPNPAQQKLFIATGGGIKKGDIEIFIFNEHGKLIMKKKFVEGICKGGKGALCECPGTTEIDISSLTSGIYLILVKNTDDILETKRIFKE